MFSAARSAGLTLGVLVILSACAAAPPAATPTAIDSAPALAPAMTIERFLRAVNQNDLDTMASLFGTRDGPVTRTWSRQEVDDRMFLMASLLRHTDYAIAGERIVPGRRDEATQMDVQLAVTAGQVVVPFTLVLTRNRQWLIEQVGIERITHPGRQR
jgi:hypothetical protein